MVLIGKSRNIKNETNSCKEISIMMENMLQIVVIVFMLFLCALCLFAVVVIVRDIIHESALARREREREEKQLTATPAQPEPVQVVVQPAVIPAPALDPAPVAEEPAEAPVVEETAVIEEAPAEEIAVAVAEEEEDDPDAVSFNRVSLTMEEKYGTLSTEFKRYFDDIVKHAISKEGVKESKRSGSYDYKIGAYKVLRMMIKRGEIVCEFNFIDRDFNNYASESNVRIKQSATQVRVLEASAVGVVKDGIDLVCQQIAEDKEHKKELAREKRREKRRLAKEEGSAE